MKKKRFSLEQMIGVLKQAEVDFPAVEVIRKAGISEQTLYRWKAKYAGLEVSVRQRAIACARLGDRGSLFRQYFRQRCQTPVSYAGDSIEKSIGGRTTMRR